MIGPAIGGALGSVSITFPFFVTAGIFSLPEARKPLILGMFSTSR
jgi:hypothetical protein